MEADLPQMAVLTLPEYARGEGFRTAEWKVGQGVLGECLTALMITADATAWTKFAADHLVCDLFLTF